MKKDKVCNIGNKMDLSKLPPEVQEQILGFVIQDLPFEEGPVGRVTHIDRERGIITVDKEE